MTFLKYYYRLHSVILKIQNRVIVKKHARVLSFYYYFSTLSVVGLFGVVKNNKFMLFHKTIFLNLTKSFLSNNTFKQAGAELGQDQ